MVETLDTAGGATTASVLQREHDWLVKSYRYLRSAMVGLVLCLAVAVLWQSVQGRSILSSVSAYYYTPAQGIFVGVLVAIGVCMIVLKGTTEAEDILLNVAGMLAPVVAVVPTGRGLDYDRAIEACRVTDRLSVAGTEMTATDCPSVLALRQATAANVENNMVALFAVGLAGLIATVFFAKSDGTTTRRFWIGFSIAVTAYALALLAFVGFTGEFIDKAHYAAAFGMFGCVVAVAAINALRHTGVRLTEARGPWNKVRRVAGTLFFSGDRYAVVALAMVVVIAVGGVLALTNTFDNTVFYLEGTLTLLFAVFWTIQTQERWHFGNRFVVTPTLLGHEDETGPRRSARPG